MKFIDDKGKIFGKINIVDLTLLLLVIVVVIGGTYKFSQINNTTQDHLQKIDLKIEIEKEKVGLVNAIKEGDLLLDSVRGTEFGEVISKTVKSHKELVIGKDGKVEFKEIPDTYDVELEIISPAMVTEEGILIGRKPTYIGSSVRLKSNLYVFNCKVIDITK